MKLKKLRNNTDLRVVLSCAIVFGIGVALTKLRVYISLGFALIGLGLFNITIYSLYQYLSAVFRYFQEFYKKEAILWVIGSCSTLLTFIFIFISSYQSKALIYHVFNLRPQDLPLTNSLLISGATLSYWLFIYILLANIFSLKVDKHYRSLLSATGGIFVFVIMLFIAFLGNPYLSAWLSPKSVAPFREVAMLAETLDFNRNAYCTNLPHTAFVIPRGNNVIVLMKWRKATGSMGTTIKPCKLKLI